MGGVECLTSTAGMPVLGEALDRVEKVMVARRNTEPA